jgi:hypothetical protein
VHRVFRTQGQEAFLEGHEYAFDRIGGVPCRHIRYDNLKSAVRRVLFGRERIESQRWQQFRSHYGFTAWYTIPGPEGAHEKGGVEGEVVGSAATIWCRCPASAISPSSTSGSRLPTPPLAQPILTPPTYVGDDPRRARWRSPTQAKGWCHRLLM